MALNIPKRDSAGIASIINLPDASVELLIQALISAPILVDADEMVKHISSDVSSIPSERLSTIIDTLYSIYHFREFAGVSLSRFLDDLIDGIASSSHPELESLDSKDINFTSLRERFEKLLNIDTLKIVSKAARLQSDGERLYCTDFSVQ